MSVAFLLLLTAQLNSIEGEHYAIPIIEDRRGGIWYGTLNSGLYHLSGDATTHYLESNGLASNTIMAIEEDDSGAIWISTNRGLNLLVIESDTTRIYSYDIRDGLQDNEFSKLSSAKLTDGKVLFGGIVGFNYFAPSEFERDEVAPRSMITDFEVDRESIYRGNMVEDGVILQRDQRKSTLPIPMSSGRSIRSTPLQRAKQDMICMVASRHKFFINNNPILKDNKIVLVR